MARTAAWSLFISMPLTPEAGLPSARRRPTGCRRHSAAQPPLRHGPQGPGALVRPPPGDWDSVEIPAGSGNWVKIGPGKSVIDRCGEFKEGWLRWLHRIIKREEYLPRDVPKPVLSEKPGVQHQ